MDVKLELLSPAKNKEQGIAAINHGADAVYIGAPQYGARVAASNTMADIEALVKYAHIFHCKVFATVNTLLFDDELEEARQMIWQLYHAGVDALIVQDMGLLELDLPPIELHASTQTHNIDPRRIKFLEQVGFSRIILAREATLDQMKEIRNTTQAELEAFVQGALCVSYSGQCYMSQYLNSRSGNRGACSQPCRSAYDLTDGQGNILYHNQHLLSLKDFSAAQHIESMIDAGIRSFKIEGRLKDICYVKNITAYYRKLIDSIIARREGFAAASSGRTSIHFLPDPERTFNRGFTDYFLVKRQPMASHATQKSLGKRIGTVVESHGNQLTIKTKETLTAGDGLCFFNNQKQLEGFLVNHVNGNTVAANKPVELQPGTPIWRNNDYAFEKKLEGDTSERKISVSMTFGQTSHETFLSVVDEDGCQATVKTSEVFATANNPQKAQETIEKQLGKLGGTPFRLDTLNLQFDTLPFLPASTLNDLRRRAVERLEDIRIERFRPIDKTHRPNDIPYFEQMLDYRANIINSQSESFYRRHQAQCAERGLEQTQRYDGKALMTCKYCLRYELGQCLMHKNNKTISPDYQGELFLTNNGKRFRLQFNCKQCEMQIFAE